METTRTLEQLKDEVITMHATLDCMRDGGMITSREHAKQARVLGARYRELKHEIEAREIKKWTERKDSSGEQLLMF